MLVLVLDMVLAAPAGAAIPDTWITSKTKLPLLTTAGVRGIAINVDTVFARVTLHGVSNLHQVVAATDEQVGQVADDALTERIRQELHADPVLHDSRIIV
jgi:osmotically-inducible protein OsmY